MTTATVQMTRDEIIQRGEEIYERDIRHLVEAGNEGRVVAIDVISGEYEMAEDALTSIGKLRARMPGAAIFVLRVGHPGLHRIHKTSR
ncbi:MAG: hypothetical protein ABI977_06195 [Acidobacteriota bacterium]